jgi:hypothetical protein
VEQIGDRKPNTVCPGCKKVVLFELIPVNDGNDWEGKCPSCKRVFPLEELPPPVTKIGGIIYL